MAAASARALLQHWIPESPRSRFVMLVWAVYVLFSSAWIAFSDWLLAVLVDPELMIATAIAKGIAFVLVTSGVLVLALTAMPPADAPRLAVTPPRWRMLVIAASVTVAVCAVTALVARAALDRFARESSQRIEAIARLKAEGVSRWMLERRNDARTLTEGTLTSDLAQRWLLRRDEADEASLRRVLQRWHGNDGVRGVYLLDLGGRVLLADGPGLSPATEIQPTLSRAIEAGQIQLLDLHKDPSGAIHLAWVAPLLMHRGDLSEAVGALVYDLDPDAFIFPYLRTWPLPSRTGEVLMWRRDDTVRVLVSQPRTSQNPQFGHHQPLDAEQLAERRPVLGDQPARLGPDHRGAMVLGAPAAVTGTPWTVIAKEDEDEALGLGRRLVFSAVGLVLALLAAGLVGAGAIMQQRRLRAALAEVERGRATLEAEGRFRASFEHSAFGMGHVGLDGRFLRVNQRLAEMLGIAPEEMIGRPAIEVIPEECRAELLNLRDKVLKGEIESFTQQRRHVRPDGTALHLELTMSIAPGNKDEPTYLVGVTKDVTARWAAETRLQQSETRLRKMFEVSPLGIVVLAGEARRIVQANPAACKMLDYQDDGLIGRSLLDMLASGEPPLPPLPAQPTTEELEVLERRLITRSGREIVVRAARARFDTPGEPIPLMLVMAEDITEKLATEERLRRAQRLEAIGQLTGGIAHDFNNLLAVIILEAEALEATNVPAIAQSATAILATALRGSDLTHRLLAFARKQPLHFLAVSLNELLLEMVPLLQRTLGEAIEVELRAEPEVWLTDSDPSQLHNVVLNLAINARDAMPKGGTLTLRTENLRLNAVAAAAFGLTAGEFVALSVSDTGMGMTPEVRDRALEPFFTTKPPGAGTGLGLSMVYGFARQSGGQLSLTSALGEGTTVRLLLPRSGSPNSTDTDNFSVSPLPLAHAIGHILLVDDNSALRAVTERQMVALGYIVRAVENGQAALTALREERFDLLFSDEVMPGGLSGSELAAQAQAMRPGLKVLLTSGNTHLDGTASTYPVLPKPYRGADLAAKLLEVLYGTNPGRAMTAAAAEHQA
ncbi:MAG: PAS domain S-box protein [Proteobacteria bacterium]|nr:PAS domain S-box protein [Pseudomonadota bacterium]